MLHLARSRRPRRNGEWTEAKAVTFIVTLAARRSVTLAARASGMSRKAAYAFRSRDPAFAAAWDAAYRAGSPSFEGDKSDEVYDPPVRPPLGNSVTLRSATADANPFADMDLETMCAILRDSDPRSLARAFSLP